MQEPTLDKILELEFNYIKDTANQAIDDRYKLLNFYIGIATFVATLAIGGASIGNISQFVNLQAALAGLCLLISFIGWIFLAMFIRLRQAWHESVMAMNQIKQYYSAHLPNQDLEAAFVWSSTSVPQRHRSWNIHFYSALLVIIIDTGFLTAGLTVLSIPLALSFVIGIALLFVQIFVYRISLFRNI